jgi:putative oxidoreductase
VLRLAYPLFATGRTALALLALRLVGGVAMAFHGWGKIQKPTTWMEGKFDDPFWPPLQAAAAVSEFVGGIALAVGLVTPLWCLGILATMAVALEHHIGRGDPFVIKGTAKGTWELAALHATVATSVLLAGPGRWSIDFFLFGRSRGEAPPA